MSRLGITDKDLDRAFNEGVCKWTSDDDGIYATECYKLHIFTSGGPIENFFKYCPYCGKFLVVKNYKEDR